MPISIRAIVDGLEMQSDEVHSFLHRPSGRIVTLTDDAFAAADSDDEDDNDEWIIQGELADARKIAADDDEYLALPDRFEIDEYHMMERFARNLDDEGQREAALTALRGRGAFRYFKDTVHRLGLANAWYAYRDSCYLEVARDWCESQGVEYDDSADPRA